MSNGVAAQPAAPSAERQRHRKRKGARCACAAAGLVGRLLLPLFFLPQYLCAGCGEQAKGAPRHRRKKTLSLLVGVSAIARRGHWEQKKGDGVCGKKKRMECETCPRRMVAPATKRQIPYLRPFFLETLATSAAYARRLARARLTTAIARKTLQEKGGGKKDRAAGRRNDLQHQKKEKTNCAICPGPSSSKGEPPASKGPNHFE